MAIPRRLRLTTALTWLKCPRCSRYNIMYHARTDTHLCRMCGAEFKADFKTETVSLIQPPVQQQLVKEPPLAKTPKKQKSSKR